LTDSLTRNSFSFSIIFITYLLTYLLFLCYYGLGPVVSVDVMKDRVTGDPRGFAFVVFQEGSTVDLVMAEDKHEINHKIVDVKRAQARGVAPPSIHGKEEGAGGGAAGPSEMPSPAPTHPSASGGGGGGDRQNKGPTPEQLQNKVFVGGE
jgi:RNA-binding protein Musashi